MNLGPEHGKMAIIQLLKMHNFFTNAKNVFTACLNESNEPINTYKIFMFLLLPTKTSMTTVCDDTLDYCTLRRNFDRWVAGWHVPYGKLLFKLCRISLKFRFLGQKPFTDVDLREVRGPQMH